MFSIHVFIDGFIHSQTYIVHLLCAGYFRKIVRMQLALTSSEADVHETTHTHSELPPGYMLDTRKSLQRVSKTGA